MRKLISKWIHYIKRRNARTKTGPAVHVRPCRFSLWVRLPKDSLTFVPTIRMAYAPQGQQNSPRRALRRWGAALFGLLLASRAADASTALPLYPGRTITQIRFASPAPSHLPRLTQAILPPSGE